MICSTKLLLTRRETTQTQKWTSCKQSLGSLAALHTLWQTHALKKVYKFLSTWPVVHDYDSQAHSPVAVCDTHAWSHILASCGCSFVQQNFARLLV